MSRHKEERGKQPANLKANTRELILEGESVLGVRRFRYKEIRVG